MTVNHKKYFIDQLAAHSAIANIVDETNNIVAKDINLFIAEKLVKEHNIMLGELIMALERNEKLSDEIVIMAVDNDCVLPEVIE